MRKIIESIERFYGPFEITASGSIGLCLIKKFSLFGPGPCKRRLGRFDYQLFGVDAVNNRLCPKTAGCFPTHFETAPTPGILCPVKQKGKGAAALISQSRRFGCNHTLLVRRLFLLPSWGRAIFKILIYRNKGILPVSLLTFFLGPQMATPKYCRVLSGTWPIFSINSS